MTLPSTLDEIPMSGCYNENGIFYLIDKKDVQEMGIRRIDELREGYPDMEDDDIEEIVELKRFCSLTPEMIQVYQKRMKA